MGNVRCLTICLLLSGCASQGTTASIFDSQRPLSVAERASIINYVKAKFFDPYSIRDATISNAVDGTNLYGSKSTRICVRANAKNRLGGYTGQTATLFYFNSVGEIALTPDEKDDDSVAPFCNDFRQRYSPFLEIEQKT